MVLFGAALISFAIFLLVHTALTPRRNITAERLASIGAARESDASSEHAGPGVGGRVVAPMLRGLGRRLAALLPTRATKHVSNKLAVAGQPMGTTGFLSFVAVLSAGLALFVLVLVPQGEGGMSGTALLLALLAAGFGVVAPFVWLGGRAGRRQKEVERALPDTLDLIVVSVEAGLGLEGAIARVAERSEGPLALELRRVLADMNLGMSRRRALQGLVARTRAPGITSLVGAILQAEQTGMGVGQVLRAQSDHLRTVRRQRAEETAMKAPLKMLFPLVFFIFPSLFVVVLAPAVLALMRSLN